MKGGPTDARILQQPSTHALAAHFLDTIPGRRLLYAVVPAHLLRDSRTP
jgi:hypothetical protein